MAKKVELTNLSDHDLLLTACQTLNSLSEDFSAMVASHRHFEARMVKIDSDKISKGEVKDILEDSAKVKAELYHRVTELEQGKTDYQETQKENLVTMMQTVDTHKKYFAGLIAVWILIGLIPSILMVYFMAQ